MSKVRICTNCNKELANRHSLSRHKKNCCDVSNRFRSYPNSTQDISKSQPRSYESKIINPLQTTEQYDSQEEKLDSLEIQRHDIDGIIEKGMWKMKDEIWNYLMDFNEGRRTWKGGSLATWDNIINEKDDDTSEQEEEEEEEEEEKTFRDIVKKDEKRLLEEIDKLSQDSKFNKIAGEIYSLVNLYFNPGQKDKNAKGRKRETDIKDLFEILKRFSGRDLLKISTICQLIKKIENIRYLVKSFFEAMEEEDDKDKNRKLLITGISNEEYQELRNNLNPESIK